MSSMNYEKMTVAELRKTAKELGVKLGSGLAKQAIIDKLKEADSAGRDEEPAGPAVPAAPAPRPVRTASRKPASRAERVASPVCTKQRQNSFSRGVSLFLIIPTSMK